jgi:hypothetical protein
MTLAEAEAVVGPIDPVHRSVLADLVRLLRAEVEGGSAASPVIRTLTFSAAVKRPEGRAWLTFDWEGRLVDGDGFQSAEAARYKWSLLRSGMTFDEVEAVAGPFGELVPTLVRAGIRNNLGAPKEVRDRWAEPRPVGQQAFAVTMPTGPDSSTSLWFDEVGRYLVCTGNPVRCGSAPGFDGRASWLSPPGSASPSTAPPAAAAPAAPPVAAPVERDSRAPPPGAQPAPGAARPSVAVGRPPAVPSLAEDKVAIRYRRPGGDYEGWGLHAWNEDRTLPGITWDRPLEPTGRDDFGVYWLLDLRHFPDGKVRYIIHRGDRKEQCGKDMSWHVRRGREAWVQADDCAIYHSREEAVLSRR